MSHGRRIPEISKLMQSEVAKISKLSEFEVVAVVLYTGPMVSYLFSDIACVIPVLMDD
jgi:hypothetical protein